MLPELQIFNPAGVVSYARNIFNPKPNSTFSPQRSRIMDGGETGRDFTENTEVSFPNPKLRVLCATSPPYPGAPGHPRSALKTQNPKPKTQNPFFTTEVTNHGSRSKMPVCR
jgi:hypothetical protein